MIVPFSELPGIRLRHIQDRIVFTGGCFDLIHEGHVQALSGRKAQGDVLVVGVSTDERIKERKGPSRPIRHELARIAVIDAFRFVDYSFLMPDPADESPTFQVLQTLKPNIFADGVENSDRWSSSRERMRALGVELYIDETRLNSTTALISAIQGRF